MTAQALSDLMVIVKLAATLPLDVFLVGGAVRDVLRGHHDFANDIDVVVEGDARLLARAVHASLGGALQEFSDFYTAKITVSERRLDFVSARSEQYPAPGALPVVRLATVQQDLLRRDFTVNAMAIRAQDILAGAVSESTVVDPTGGLRDLQEKKLRIIHAQSFIDDPTRLFRIFRYAHRLRFEIESDTEKACMAATKAGALETISLQRIFTELRKASEEINWSALMVDLLKAGIFPGILSCSREQTQRLIAALQRIPMLRTPIPNANELFQAALFVSLPEHQRRSAYGSAGFSKKKIEKFAHLKIDGDRLPDGSDATELAIFEMFSV